MATFSFSRTTDYELVRCILTHPKLWNRITDDGAPSREDFRPVESPAVWYVLVRDAGELLGVWAFVQQNAVTWEIHVALLPNALAPKGRSREAFRHLLDWFWAQSGAQRIIAAVPEYNRLAVKFARDVGFTYFGLNPGSWLKGGHLYAQILLGLSRPPGGTDADPAHPQASRRRVAG